MKILLVLNKPIREIPIMESIRREIVALEPDSHVEIREMCAPGFVRFVMTFRPDVILTFPFTCIGFSQMYYLFKMLYATKIVCFRAEGVIGLNSEYDVRWATGFDAYGESLVDYEVFWGSSMAQAVGSSLLAQHKLSGRERIRSIGYPRLEAYFADAEQAPLNVPTRIINRIAAYNRQDILLCITGFHLANYTRQNLFDAKDLDAENNVDNLLEGVEISKQFRAKLIETIISTADQHHKQLFIVKKHPIERTEDYAVLETIPNILYVHEDIELQNLIPYVGLFLHYGSTALVDSYLSGVPSVYIYSTTNKQWYSDLGWPSSVRAEVAEIPTVIQDYLNGKVNFRMTAGIKQIMKDIFNIEEGKPYRPSREIAQLLLAADKAQRVPLSDHYLWKAVIAVLLDSGLIVVSRIIKWIFRIPPEVSLLRKLKLT